MAQQLTKEQHERIYYFLRLTRLVEERLANLSAQGKVIGSLYRSLGQEGTAVGSAAALDPEQGDVAAPILRDLGALLTLGGKPVEVFQQYMAKGTGPSKGRELNIHFGAPERNFIGPVSMLGEMIPLMAGVALGMKMRKQPGVALCYIGDGGASTGPTHEGLNFAAVLDLPFILVVENNGFAYSTPTKRQSRLERLSDRALAYGIPGVTVDGNDVLAVYEATAEAAERARRGEGPTLIESVTFRMKGHAQHDNQAYVPREMIAEWEEKDPIARYERHLLENGIHSREELDAVVARINAELDEAVRLAEESPMPEPATAAVGTFDGSVATRAQWLAPLT
jgi:pyruvate dehydrogenase E1 component alpha subunit/2-oxoisovalerate dehydrogenase E1 component alpha subunit